MGSSGGRNVARLMGKPLRLVSGEGRNEVVRRTRVVGELKPATNDPIIRRPLGARARVDADLLVQPIVLVD